MSSKPDAYAPDARQIPVQDLPDEVLPFLLGSRYCDMDKLSQTAWNLFGGTPEGWARVQAIVDYAHGRLRFDYRQADATRSAFDGHGQQVGVCRDVAHLAITLCRCMNIPARYATGHLGDIGVPIDPVPIDSAPMDFSAWFEAYLDGSAGPRWYTFDARHNRPRIGRIVMAYGWRTAAMRRTARSPPASVRHHGRALRCTPMRSPNSHDRVRSEGGSRASAQLVRLSSRGRGAPSSSSAT